MKICACLTVMASQRGANAGAPTTQHSTPLSKHVLEDHRGRKKTFNILFCANNSQRIDVSIPFTQK